jgi:UDP-N-acetylglucosamine--N-acetylmuramyl-(pentapeptide) pyrophosphoryl-undecaprenol N-acetylglucosamine transferase
MSANGGPVLIMAGGTGGHIFPGLALADELRKRGIGVRWLGAAGGMECRQVPAHGIEIDTVRIAGVRGKGIGGWLALPFRLARAVRDAWKSMKRQRPACVVSFGGFAAGPGGLAARIRGLTLIVHEQNRIPGMTNRFLARLAQRVFQAFDHTFEESIGALTCGNPVRAGIGSLAEPRERFASRTQRQLRLLVTGGSQGAEKLNRLLPLALGRLPEGRRPDVLHQAGRNRVDRTLEAYSRQGVQAEVVEFIDDMAAEYGRADLAICRSGALTVSELSVAGLGAILVPFPHAVDDHQTANAEVLLEVGAAVVLQETALDEVVLAQELDRLLADRSLLLQMAENARQAGPRDAAQAMADYCAGFVRANGDAA